MLSVLACVRAGEIHSRGFLANSGRLQPEVVAHTLAQLEDTWTAEADAFLECTSTGDIDREECARAPEAFKVSCKKVVGAVMQASSGERTEVQEYMSDICGNQELGKSKQERCNLFSSALLSSMSDDTYTNREHFNGTPVCTELFQDIAETERARTEAMKLPRAVASAVAAEAAPAVAPAVALARAAEASPAVAPAAEPAPAVAAEAKAAEVTPAVAAQAKAALAVAPAVAPARAADAALAVPAKAAAAVAAEAEAAPAVATHRPHQTA